MNKVYKIQSYLVIFDTRSPVDIHISVYHENQTKLTREEIIKETIGYAEDVGIVLSEQDICEIKEHLQE